LINLSRNDTAELFSDFITVDGAEWNRCCTLFSDAVGMPIEPALIFVNKTLIT
jgi:hypothetical protein